MTLKQLRLAKWQFIWNKEFELLSLEKIDQDAIEKAELGSKIPEDQLKVIKQQHDQKVHLTGFEMAKGQMEVSLLDAVIAELQKQFNDKWSEADFEGTHVEP